MSGDKMHAEEVDIDSSLVHRLLVTQLPQWADLPLMAVPSAGTDNALYRLGEHLVVRLPRIHEATEQVDKEQRWLPRLVSHLPLAIPVPLAKGTPGEGYPWQWSVYRWLEGEDATTAPVTDLGQAARDLAQFIGALQRIEPAGGPAPGQHNFFRGVPLALRDASTRAAITTLEGMPEIGLETEAVTAAWDVALHTPPWNGPPVWIHGDLQPLNLLVRQGRLTAVIDWGGLGVGDPACDLIAAWTFLTAETRASFRAALPVDDETWARGRGWALSMGLIALPYYQHTNPTLAGIAHRGIEAVLADQQRAL